jgi:hypothetical protein
MTHIYYTLTGLFLLSIAIFVTSAFTITESITGLINEFKNRPMYATVFTMALLGVSYFTGGTLSYHLYKENN